MKKLNQYIVESKKTYPFKIGIAGDVPADTKEKLKMHLEKFGVSNLSTGKRTPIQERPLDFPNLQNLEVTYFEVELIYPTIDSVLKEYIVNVCNFPRSHIVVRNANGPLEEIQNKVEDNTYETLLNKEDLGGESAQEFVGNSRVMDLLKELEVARKERDKNSSGFKIETFKEEPQNKKSVVGK
jgi:hypothetical protein